MWYNPSGYGIAQPAANGSPVGAAGGVLKNGGPIVEDVYLFANTRSGGQRGKRFLEVPQPFQVDISPNHTASLCVFDIAEGDAGQKPGFLALKQLCASRLVRVAVAGGDGTILWAVEEAARTGIDVCRQIQFVIVPLGTGNDFSRFTGWGGHAPNMSKLLQNNYQGLADLVRDWLAAKVQLHDIWDLKVQVDDRRGAIIINKKGKKEEVEAKTVEKCMHSYCSMGWDARAGMEQEKHRTSSRLGNLFNYGLQICIKGTPCRQKHRVADFVESLHHGSCEDSKLVFKARRASASNGCQVCSSCSGHGAEVAAESDDERDQLMSKTPVLLRSPEVLVFLNIPNCYSGLCRFWEGAKRVGVEPALDDALLQAGQSASDGKLEVVTYDNVFQAALASTGSWAPSSKGASRVFSGAPLHLRFREDLEEDSDVHVQIDGEFYKLRNPESLTIQLRMQIQVLHSSRSISPGDPEEEGTEASDESDASEESESGGFC